VASPSGDQFVVIRNGGARFQPIQVATDYGAQLEVADGVHFGDLLVESVTDEIREGTKVRVATPPHSGLHPRRPSGPFSRPTVRHGPLR
jgi:hypothetical protein